MKRLLSALSCRPSLAMVGALVIAVLLLAGSAVLLTPVAWRAPDGYWVQAARLPNPHARVLEIDDPTAICTKWTRADTTRSNGCYVPYMGIAYIRRGLSPEDKECVRRHEVGTPAEGVLYSHAMGYDHPGEDATDWIDCGDGTIVPKTIYASRFHQW